MEDVRKIKWQEIVKLIYQADGKSNPIKYDDRFYQFVIVRFIGTDVGFMTLWEDSSLRAIHLSRIKIPNNIECIEVILDSEENVSLVPPNLNYERL